MERRTARLSLCFAGLGLLFDSPGHASRVCVDPGHSAYDQSKSGPVFTDSTGEKIWAMRKADPTVLEMPHFRFEYVRDSKVAGKILEGWVKAGNGGLLEFISNWKIGSYLASLMAGSVMTKSNQNEAVTWENRGEVAIGSNCDIYVSVHTNSNGSTTSHPITFHYSKSTYNAIWYEHYVAPSTHSDPVAVSAGTPILNVGNNYFRVTPTAGSIQPYPVRFQILGRDGSVVTQNQLIPNSNVYPTPKAIGDAASVETGEYVVGWGQDGEYELKLRGPHQGDDDKNLAQAILEKLNLMYSANSLPNSGGLLSDTRLKDIRYASDLSQDKEAVAVIVESGFHSNPDFEKWLYNDGDDSNYHKVAQAIADGIDATTLTGQSFGINELIGKWFRRNDIERGLAGPWGMIQYVAGAVGCGSAG
ncbi:MAG: N-acetylmuramoyl-L-alanine amidase [Elusimicrobiota bacterium]